MILFTFSRRTGESKLWAVPHRVAWSNPGWAMVIFANGTLRRVVQNDDKEVDNHTSPNKMRTPLPRWIPVRRFPLTHGFQSKPTETTKGAPSRVTTAFWASENQLLGGSVPPFSCLFVFLCGLRGEKSCISSGALSSWATMVIFFIMRLSWRVSRPPPTTLALVDGMESACPF